MERAPRALGAGVATVEVQRATPIAFPGDEMGLGVVEHQVIDDRDLLCHARSRSCSGHATPGGAGCSGVAPRRALDARHGAAGAEGLGLELREEWATMVYEDNILG